MSIKYKVIERHNPLDKEAPKKAYGIALHGKNHKLGSLAKELATYSTTASEGDVFSVAIGLRDLIRKYLANGDKVTIDGIGTFSVNISSEGAESVEKFHQSMIKKPKIVFAPDAEMKEFLATIKYEKEASKKPKE